MLVFGTELHLVTLVFILLELMMFGYQLVYFLVRPDDKGRFYYLMLLKLMLFYNITGGLFPDPEIKLFSLRSQQIIAYGSGFLMASYFPYYFYEALELRALRRHALYGVPLFLMLPYFVFFVADYTLHGDLQKDLRYGMILPFFYALVLLRAILKAIRDKYRAERNRHEYREEIAMYCAVSPWASLAVFGMLEESQVIEALFTNSGIVIISVLFIRKSILKAREEHRLLLQITQHGNEAVFEANCKRLGLTVRETEIVPLLIEGKAYKEIAELLFVSERTIDTHVRNIYRKCGVNNKIGLLNVLYRLT